MSENKLAAVGIVAAALTLLGVMHTARGCESDRFNAHVRTVHARKALAELNAVLKGVDQ